MMIYTMTRRVRRLLIPIAIGLAAVYVVATYIFPGTKSQDLRPAAAAVRGAGGWSDFYHPVQSGGEGGIGGGGDHTRDKNDLAPGSDPEDASALVETARRIQKRHGVVYFCMINDAYFDFAASWLCNTAHMNVHDRVLFLTTDLATGRRLKAGWPNVSVAAMNTMLYSGFRNYSQAGHVRMMTERTRFILRMLEGGVQPLLFEVDCLWLRDPLPLVLAKKGTDTDIVGTKISGQKATAAGFLLLAPTTKTVKFWTQLTKNLDGFVKKTQSQITNSMVSENDNEQMYFNKLAYKNFAGVRISFLYENDFPDGKWYQLPKEKRDKSRPALINNNWIIGKMGKRERAKAFGHWFWDDAGQRCNATAVQIFLATDIAKQ